jgi:uncharacterized protein (DUF1697 family)
MPVYVALLRAINVGGTGKLPMSDLEAMCVAAGFSNVRTYIASGNVVFRSGKSAAKVKHELEKRLQSYAGKPVGVAIRTADELSAVLESNPFKRAQQSKAVAIFLDSPPPADALDDAVGQAREEVRLGKREIYVHYVDGIGRSKLRIPAAREGTMRNMNTIVKLVAIAAETGDG